MCKCVWCATGVKVALAFTEAHFYIWRLRAFWKNICQSNLYLRLAAAERRVIAFGGLQADGKPAIVIGFIGGLNIL